MKNKEEQLLYWREWRKKNRNKCIEATKKWKKNNPEKVRIWLEKNREKRNLQAIERRKKNPEKFRLAKLKFRRIHHDRLITEERNKRIDVIKKYGGTCICCGETQIAFLALDHIKGGGNKHRREVGRKMYLWAIKNNYPKILQVLCHNCNQAKHIYGKCPHKK
jgi:hypothetical protein